MPEGRGEGGSGSEGVVEEPGWKLPDSLIENARYLRKNQTDAEKLLWELLRNRQFYNFKFKRQHPIKPGFILDFYCAKKKLAIEVDGSIHDEEDQKLSDEERTQILNEKGIDVIRFKNEDVLNNTEQVLKSLAGELGVYSALTPVPSPTGGRGVPEGRGEGESGHELTIKDIYNRIGRDISIEKANELINSITICDPAVGSGHFLVSCLNELIAIKSELGILADEDGKLLRGVTVEVENDELIVIHGENLFEYDVQHTWSGTQLKERKTDPEKQRIQKTLFHEKRHLIENCLFGVDINPNSVKICRLRLWIELLKRAYYNLPSPAGGRGAGGEGGELEVLPNIDINIKQGNSLVSRFELDSDLGSVFKNSNHSLEDYKQAVRSYKHTGDRTEKQRLQKLIDEIKEEYTTTLTNIRPINKKLSKARGRLELMQSDDLFGDVKFTKKDIEKQKKKVQKLDEQKAEEESGAFYNQAFEWRFEFPEVLDDEGRFTGFDVVIGNPPYIFGRDWKKLGMPDSLKDYYNNKYDLASYQIDLYILFIERSFQITKSTGLISLIVPNSWLNNTYANVVRKYVLKNSPEISLIESPPKTFQDVNVDTILFVINKSKSNYSDKMHLRGINIEQELKYSFSHHKKYYLEGDTPISLNLTEEQAKLIKKIKEAGVALENLCDITRGIHPYRTGGYGKSAFQDGPQIKKDVEERPYNSSEKLKDYRPFIYGKNLNRFSQISADEYIKYGDWLAEPRNPKFFEGERVYSRKILGERLVVTYINDDTVADQQVYITKPKDSKIDSKYLTGVLGSKLISFFIRFYFDEREDLFPQIKVSQLKSLPVINVENELTTKISDRISKLIQADIPKADTTELEAEIDRMVYELYGLTKDEIKVVEGEQ